MNRHIAIFTLAALALGSSVGHADDRRMRCGTPDIEAAAEARKLQLKRGVPARLVAFRSPLARVTRDITGDRCATRARAEADARVHLISEVKEWLVESGVDRKWVPPQAILRDMVIGQAEYTPETIHDTEHELNLVRATITADFSEVRKSEFLDHYRRQVAGQRLALLGGGLFVVLAGLAAISGYIRADEATKGYYTNRLRILAAAGVGAAGVAVYNILT